MLYMVIERFKNGDIAPVGERYRKMGRLMPDGLNYVASWLNPGGTICFQIMESASPQLLDTWISNWNDLVDFEVTPVVTSSEFWERRSQKG